MTSSDNGVSWVGRKSANETDQWNSVACGTAGSCVAVSIQMGIMILSGLNDPVPPPPPAPTPAPSRPYP